MKTHDLGSADVSAAVSRMTAESAEATEPNAGAEPIPPHLVDEARRFCEQKLVAQLGENVHYHFPAKDDVDARVAREFVSTQPDFIRQMAAEMKEGVTYSFHALECLFGRRIWDGLYPSFRSLVMATPEYVRCLEAHQACDRQTAEVEEQYVRLYQAALAKLRQELMAITAVAPELAPAETKQ
ncbi:MAG: hypothetical protein PHT12_01695 [Patescibacteria group bacterium]|nr:hypothetical protein [Patescibacteria group bacterium]